MKRLVMLLGLSLLLVGCNGSKVSDENRDYTVVGTKEGFSTSRTVIEDKETGCYYLESMYNFTPYYDEDGNVKGCGKGVGTNE